MVFTVETLFLKDPRETFFRSSQNNGKDKIISINALSEKLELPKCRGLLMSHAFTGCDYVLKVFQWKRQLEAQVCQARSSYA